MVFSEPKKCFCLSLLLPLMFFYCKQYASEMFENNNPLGEGRDKKVPTSSELYTREMHYARISLKNDVAASSRSIWIFTCMVYLEETAWYVHFSYFRIKSYGTYINPSSVSRNPNCNSTCFYSAMSVSLS